MRRDSRLSVALHVLLHMSDVEGPVTSEALAERLRMNAVVLRRTLAALREAGIVRGEKGHGGGWALARDLASVSLDDVLVAIGAATLFSIGPRDEATKCPIEQAVDRAIGAVLVDAETLITRRLRGISVASLVARGRRRLHQAKEIHSHV
jgi:Rrf2 family protein